MNIASDITLRHNLMTTLCSSGSYHRFSPFVMILESKVCELF